MLDILLPMVLIFGMIAVFQIGATPTITVFPPDEDNCQRVLITRFWEESTILDAVSCDGQPINFNGENLLETQ